MTDEEREVALLRRVPIRSSEPQRKLDRRKDNLRVPDNCDPREQDQRDSALIEARNRQLFGLDWKPPKEKPNRRKSR